ncbi:hypothetical protein SAMN05192574_101392 [Mucilaginibacter gossypiicola]|uniref:Uncharacterized protein n=1 Tax=Mucilaginibacter gossypiicola TaxID=551995 RepID=A0A1H8A6X4_9SPHI|nr:hypothetical protein [Mucilaginibacter gossypiicola]SEM66535.1 hypothetical protein SAMN05192574_101392 [Mucilaginibacter gossypiicola]
MSVTLYSPLPVIAFSKNPIVLQLMSDDYLTTAPAFSVNTVEFPGAVTDGLQIGLSWNAGSASLTAATTPDISGNQFPTGDGSNAYVASLVDYFEGNYFIDQAFKVSVNTSGAHPKLVFTAKVASTDYDITPAANQAVATPGTSGSQKANFMHHIEVWKYNPSGGDVKVYDANVSLDEPKTGITTLDISESLHSFMGFDSPSLTGSYWQLCSKSCWQYYVKYAQFFGDDPSVKKLNKTGLHTVVYGGYSNLALQQIADRVNYLQTYLLPDPSLYAYQCWLETWPVDYFSIKTNQAQFLSFVNNLSATETLAVQVDITYQDNTLQTIYLTGGTVLSMQKVAVGCGYQQLGLNGYGVSGNRAASYIVTLVNGTSHESRSKPKRFIVDRNYEQYTRYFLYADSCGNFKTLRTFGRSELSSDAEFDLTAFQPDIATLPESGNYQNSNIKAVLNDKINSGYISAGGIYDAIVELQLSKQVFRVFGNKLTPVVMTTKKFDFRKDGTGFSAAVLEYRLAYDEDLHTADSYALAIPSLNNSQQAINDI